MPPPTVNTESIMFCGRPTGRPSVVRLSTLVSRDALSLCLLSGGISSKLAV